MKRIGFWICPFLILALNQSCFSAMNSQDLTLAIGGPTFTKVGDYRIGPGDELELRVFGEESVSGSYVVAPSGMIQLPLVGYVIAQGMSQVQLAQKLEMVLKPFVRDPKVAVSVRSAASFVVFFSGEVQSRGPKELKFRANVLQGLVMAGGLSTLASGKIYLIRTVSDHEVRRYSTSYRDLLRGGRDLDFVYLERGDIIHAE